MYVTNVSGCGSGGPWESLATSKSWTLGQTNTTATVYVKFKGSDGNESSCVNDTIIHDSSGPAVASVTVSNSSPTATQTYTLSFGSAPADSASYCILENDTTVGNCGWTALPLPASYGASTTENAKVLSVWLKDNAGNIGSRVDSNSVTLLTTPPTAPSVSGTSPTVDFTPTWSWVGGGGGIGTFRYKLDDSDLTSGASVTTSTSVAWGSNLSSGAHTLYVQESGASGLWSSSGTRAITVQVPTVNARYTPQPNWNDYVKTAATGTACAGTETNYSDCIHSSEHRAVLMTGKYPDQRHSGERLQLGSLPRRLHDEVERPQ
jgi:hypothetical protein